MERLRELNPQVLFYSHDGIGRKPAELIRRAAENTKAFGDIILKALQKEATPEATEHRVEEYISSHLGINTDGMDKAMTVKGFVFYFKKKGVV